MFGLRKGIQVFVYVCILINLIIFLAACNLPSDRLKKNVEEGRTEVQGKTEISVNSINSISENRTTEEKNLAIRDKNTREYKDFFLYVMQI